MNYNSNIFEIDKKDTYQITIGIFANSLLCFMMIMICYLLQILLLSTIKDNLFFIILYGITMCLFIFGKFYFTNLLEKQLQDPNANQYKYYIPAVFCHGVMISLYCILLHILLTLQYKLPQINQYFLKSIFSSLMILIFTLGLSTIISYETAFIIANINVFLFIIMKTLFILSLIGIGLEKLGQENIVNNNGILKPLFNLKMQDHYQDRIVLISWLFVLIDIFKILLISVKTRKLKCNENIHISIKTTSLDISQCMASASLNLFEIFTGGVPLNEEIYDSTSSLIQ